MSGLTQFAGRDSLSCETRWKYLSSIRKYRRLTTFYKMDNKLCPQYMDNCLPPTVSNISDHDFRNDESYTTIK
jgi:hypothetical protein